MNLGISRLTHNLCLRLIGCMLGFGLMIAFNYRLARADDGLESLLNSILSIFASSSGSGCLGRGLQCTNSQFCADECGTSFECQRGVCKSISNCFSDSDCVAGLVCFQKSKLCTVPSKFSNCTRDAECPPGIPCDSTSNICIGNNGQECAGLLQVCNDLSMPCCRGANLSCISGRCHPSDSPGELGDDCEVMPPFYCKGEENLVCDATLHKCLKQNGAMCNNNSDCLNNSGCVNGICRVCKRSSGGGCLLALGDVCVSNQDCESSNCDSASKVCVRAPTTCADDQECSKEPNPKPLDVKSFCAPSGTCSFCMLTGKDVINDYQCCEPAISYEGKCLLGIGQACSDNSECISGKCDNGVCAENVDNSTSALCYTDEACQRENSYWRCCLPGSNMSSEVCNSDHFNKCVAWFICGNNCCEGSEDAQTCPRDCPQNPINIPTWCTPNQPLLDGGLTQANECRMRCLQSRSCGGAWLGNCQCNDPCNGSYCYEKTCQTTEEVCRKWCVDKSGLQTVGTLDGTINCNCGSVTSEFGGPEAMQVSGSVCSSLWACRDDSCPGKYKCCNKRDDGSFHPYGDCFGTVPVEEGPQT